MSKSAHTPRLPFVDARRGDMIIFLKGESMMIVKRSDFEMKKCPDSDPDLSYLGTYSNKPHPNVGPDEFLIDRAAKGDQTSRECRWFIASNCENLEQAEQNYKRMEAINSGQVSIVGVRAVVTLEIPNGSGGTISQVIKSPGLWGVESDANDDHFTEIYSEECDQLAAMLTEMGMKVEA